MRVVITGGLVALALWGQWWFSPGQTLFLGEAPASETWRFQAQGAQHIWCAKFAPLHLRGIKVSGRVVEMQVLELEMR